VSAKHFVIAIDGPAASGKGTLARRLAAHFGYDFLDTGTLYRGVGLSVLRQGLDPADEKIATAAAKALTPEILADPAIRAESTSSAASKVAAIPSVRAAVLNWQRDFARKAARDSGGAVLDGRDIGTVICPNADVKIFVDARLDIRARRRWAELKAMGIRRAEQDVVAELQARDLADKNRPVSPLKQAPDADLLDTSDLGIDAAFAAALALVSPKVEKALAARHRG